MGLYFNIASFIFYLIILLISYFILKNKKIKNCIVIAILVLFIFFSYTKYLENRYNSAFSNHENSTELIVKIVSSKEEGDYYYKYEGKIKNRKYQDLKILMYIKKDIEFKYGDILKVSGEISKPNKARNEDSFNYAQYLKQKKICATIQIEKYEKLKMEKDFFYYIYKLKDICLTRINEMYNGKESGFLNAILFGKTDNLDENLREDFKLSSLSHILAISGIHVSYIILGLEKLLKLLIKNIKLRNFFIIVFLIVFIPFVGGSASVARACIMVIISYIAKILLQKDDFYSSFCIALFILLIMNPYNINSVSMWLSFGGSIGIVTFSKFLNKIFIKNVQKINVLQVIENYYNIKLSNENKVIIFIKKMFIKVIEISIISLSAQIIIFPIMIYYFNTISFSFWISNVLTSGLIAPILILGYLSVILYPISIVLLYVEKVLIKILFIIIQICAKMPLNQIFVPSIRIYLLIMYYVAIFYLIYKFSKNKFYYLRRILNKKYIRLVIQGNLKKIKKNLVILVLLITFFNSIKYIPNDLRINFLDVGQGDCTLLRTSKNKTILVDCGEGNSDKYDYGKNVVFPYLLDKGIMRIDYIIISHFDSDHARWNVLYFRKYESR